MSSNDLRRLINKFLLDEDAEVHSFGGTSEFINEVFPFFKDLVQFEFPSPDGYSKIDNKILILEHFEFDSNENLYKGSEGKKELARINREINKTQFVTNVPTPNKINCTYKMNQYIDNSINAFNNHYVKISSYTDNLKAEKLINDNTEIKTMFLIEDTTLLGNISYSTGKLKPIILAQCDKFLDVFEKNKNVDYVMCFSEHNMKQFVYFLSQSSVKNYRENELKVNEIEIID